MEEQISLGGWESASATKVFTQTAVWLFLATTAYAFDVTVGMPFEIALTPEVPRQAATFAAPEAGVLRFELLDDVGHEVQPSWLVDGTSSDRQSVFAVTGAAVTLTVTLVSNEPLSAHALVSLSPEPFVEPNDSIAEAQAIETGTAASFRLMPRYDRDVFAVTAPEDGAFIFEFSETGGHETTVEWLDAERKRRAAEGEFSVYARAGENPLCAGKKRLVFWR